MRGTKLLALVVSVGAVALLALASTSIAADAPPKVTLTVGLSQDVDTVTADVWIYDPETLLEPWYVRQTYKQVSNPDVRIGYWYCGENPNNTVVETGEGTSQFKDFTFTDKDDKK